MLNNQHAFQASNNNANAELSSVQLEHVSVSQLLGRDYIFIDAQGVKLPLHNPSLMHTLLSDLIQQLELSESHTVVVSIDESNVEHPSFIRHELSWHRHEICRIDSIAIIQQEQHEFIEMIWRCSTAAMPA